MTPPFDAPDEPFRLEEATIDDLHQASGPDARLRRGVRHYIARARAFNGVASMLVTPDGAPVPEAPARHGDGAAALPDRDVKAATSCPISTGTRGAAGIWPHGSDRVGRRRPAAVRHDRRHAECRTGQRARTLNIRASAR